MILANVFALAIAVALTKKIVGVSVFRSMFFIPYIMSMTIVGFIWKFIFSQGFAVLYEKTSLEFLNWSWLGSGKLAFYSVVFVGVWQALGFYIVLYIAGLQAVPTDVLEAATIDGANGVNKFFRVTLPLLKPSIITCVFMSLTNSLKVFDIILALTKGGPVNLHTVRQWISIEKLSREQLWSWFCQSNRILRHCTCNHAACYETHEQY